MITYDVAYDRAFKCAYIHANIIFKHAWMYVRMHPTCMNYPELYTRMHARVHAYTHLRA